MVLLTKTQLRYIYTYTHTHTHIFDRINCALKKTEVKQNLEFFFGCTYIDIL